MKKINKSFLMGKWLVLLSVFVLCSIMSILYFLSDNIIKKQEDQHMSTRWSPDGSSAHISCFFSVNTKILPDYLEDFGHVLDDALEQASITQDSPNANARLWVDAYSATGQIIMKSNMEQIKADAIGIGGDFFLFHPVKLLNGAYFSGNDIMQDYCVLDEDAAWQLFGSNDIAGQIVYIGDVAHVVSGVIKKEESDLYKAAGLDGSLVYVSYSTLIKYGNATGINHYEIVMPNPVKGYAKSYVEGAIGVEQSEMEIIENSDRYSLYNRIAHISKLSNRAMNGKAIIYPYWENVARATEDKLAVIMCFQLTFLCLFSIILFVFFVIWRKKVKRSMKDIFLRLYDGMQVKISGMITGLKRLKNGKNKKREQ